MPGPVERWLGTFMCKQYADLFEAYGFKTLHSVCQLQLSTLHSMGIPPEHCDKILENVCVLRQSLVGSVGPGYSEHDYDPQMVIVNRPELRGGGHNQGSNYSYHSSPGYPPPPHQQYGNPTSQMSHGMSYQSNDSYSSGQVHYTSTGHQDVYPQPLYNSRLHGGHGAWDDPMSVYNHPSRHVMAGGMPPSASMMRSPPPPPPLPSSSSSGQIGLPHYPRHIIMDSLPPTAHHAWSTQGQMLSPRATPSPGITRPTSSLSSPSLANCSPAHSSSKPFSPPPYSPHPPPAHQQHSPAAYNDYPPPPPSAPIPSPAPSIGTPSRPMSQPSSVSSCSPSDPLQSLQKMVLLDSQNLRTISRQMSNLPQQQQQHLQQQQQQQQQQQHLQLRSGDDGDDEDDVGSTKSSMKTTPKFSSVEQLASPSPSPSVASQRTGTSLSQKSSNIGTPSPQQPPCEDDSNEGSTIEVVGRMSERSVHAVDSLSGDPRSGLMLEDEEGEEVLDDNSLDVVGHENNKGDIDVKLDQKVTVPFRGRKKEVIQQQQQQQNGYLSPMNDASGVDGESEHVIEATDTSKVIANGIMSDSYRGSELDDVDKRTHSLVDDNSERKSSSRNRTRRKQCLPMFVRSPPASPALIPASSFYANETNNYASQEEMCSVYKVNGDGEKVELTELKPVKRFTGDQGKLLSVTSAMEIVRNCDQQIQSGGSGCPSTTSTTTTMTPLTTMTPFCPRPEHVKSEDGGGRYQRKANVVQQGLVATIERIRTPDMDVSGASKTVIITAPTSILNSARVSVLKQGSQLGASFKIDSSQVSNFPPTPCGYATDASLSAEERDAIMKPRRGRPPGSKNKPKPPGFEKKTKNGAKQKVMVATCAPTTPTTTVIVVDASVPPARPAPAASSRAPRQPELNQNQCKSTVVHVEAGHQSIALRKQHLQLSETTRPRGPYVHLSGRNRNSPISLTVVNTITKDDEADSKGSIGGGGGGGVGRGRVSRKWAPVKVDGRSAQLKKMTNVGFNSTMSANYDVFTKDKTWVCSLCKKGSHYNGLGDLFGPYFGRGGDAKPNDLAPGPKKNQSNDDDEEDTPVSRKVRAKRKRSELVEDFIKSTMAKKGKRVSREVHKTSLMPLLDAEASVNVAATASRPNSLPGRHFATPSDAEDEFWVHEDCIVWSHGVHLLGPRVIGLNDAISEASELFCVKCHEGGATVGCRHKGCLEQYHFICAIEKGCQLNEENFTIFCAKHRRKPELSVT